MAACPEDGKVPLLSPGQSILVNIDVITITWFMRFTAVYTLLWWYAFSGNTATVVLRV